MNRESAGYLPKLRAVRDMKAPANAFNVSRYLDIGYETARSALRRLEIAGYLVSERKEAGRVRMEVTWKLTAKAAEALASAIEPAGIPTGALPSMGLRKARGEASTGADAAWDWRELHAALSMGDVRMPKRARKVQFGLDVEPGWRVQA